MICTAGIGNNAVKQKLQEISGNAVGQTTAL